MKHILYITLTAILCVNSLRATECPLKADASTSTASGSKNKNFGSSGNLSISSTARIYLKFDLSVLPTLNRGDIAKATIRLFCNKLPQPGAFAVYQVTSPWEEATIKSSSPPTAAESLAISQVPVTGTKSTTAFDITALLRDWVSGNAENDGVVLLPSATGISATFDSKENIGAGLAPVLEVTLNSGGVVGGITAFGGSTAPSGWLLCDGSEVSRTQYAELFAVVGTNWGAGNGTNTFNLPDLRGQFLRGADNGAGIDPDAESRFLFYSGGNEGDQVGSFQGHAFQTHAHDINDPGHQHDVVHDGYQVSPGSGLFTIASGNGPYGTVDDTRTAKTGITIQAQEATGNLAQPSASETRPVNAAVNYIIKY
jgi:microcystin-dependent protein